ncbi:MAG: hypothetical protein Q4B00_10730 [Eubacteriales bacterium]|nr:hypothetical protein [Eubacteriales bacterium]
MNQKFKKFTAISLAALLGLTAAPASAFAQSFTEIEQPALTNAISTLAQQYAQSFEEFEALQSGIHEEMTFTLDDAGRSLLGILIPVDISWFKDVRLSADISMEESAQFMTAGVYMNDTKICTLEYFFDLENLEIYMRIPELREGYIKVDYEETLKQQKAMLEQQRQALEESGEVSQAAEDALESMENSSFSDPAFIKEYMKFLTNLPEYMPEATTAENILNKYSSILFDHIENTEASESETLDIAGASEECTVYEGILSQTNARSFLKEVVETAKSDEEIKEILDKLDESLYQNFMDALDETSENLSEELEDDGSHISAKVWVTEDNTIVGRSLTLNDTDESIPIYDWKRITDGSNVQSSLAIGPEDEGFSISGKGIIENDILSGQWLLKTSSGDYDTESGETPAPTDWLTINVNSYDTTALKKGCFKGSYSFGLPSVLSADATPEENAANNPLASFQLLLDIDSDRDHGNVSLSLTNEGVSLGSINVGANLGVTAEKPDFADLTNVYDSMDEAAMNEYMSGITLDTILNNLVESGMPEELLMQLLTGGTAEEEALPEAEMTPETAS